MGNEVGRPVRRRARLSEAIEPLICEPQQLVKVATQDLLRLP